MRCVLVHAGIADARMWEPVIPWFAGHEPVGYDLRGHGQMDDVEEDWHHVDDLLDVLGEEPAVLVGAGTGARVVLEGATLAPQLVRGLVLLGPTEAARAPRGPDGAGGVAQAMAARTAAIHAVAPGREAPRVTEPLAGAAALGAPALVAVGEHGDVGAARAHARALGCELEVVAAAGDLPSLEEPGATGRLVERFLAGLA